MTYAMHQVTYFPFTVTFNDSMRGHSKGNKLLTANFCIQFSAIHWVCTPSLGVSRLFDAKASETRSLFPHQFYKCNLALAYYAQL